MRGNRVSKSEFKAKVEYLFVLELCRHTPKQARSFLAGLDGNHEGIGDAIGSLGNKWILIEFKRDAQAITRERKEKFAPGIFGMAKNQLGPVSGHHLLIFGHASNEQSLSLAQCGYFDTAINHDNWNQVLTCGTDKESFNSYLEKYLQLRKPSKSLAGGVSVSAQDYAEVLGLDVNDNVVECHSLESYSRHFQLAKALSNEHTSRIGQRREERGYER